jgi:hypothetical protein
VEGTHVSRVADFTEDQLLGDPLLWSPDGRTLFVGTLASWREGRGVAPLQLPRGANLAWAMTLAVGDGLVLRGGPGGLHHVVSSTRAPRTLQEAYPGWSEDTAPQGVDAQGRLVVVEQHIPARLKVVDPRTGDAKRVYP